MFLYVSKQTFHIPKVHIFQRVKGIIMPNLHTICYTKTNIFQDFHICISEKFFFDCFTYFPNSANNTKKIFTEDGCIFLCIFNGLTPPSFKMI